MNAVVQSQTFEQRLMDRIKDSIGELMTEEDLKRIVNRGIEEALFKERYVENAGYGHGGRKPPVVQEVVEKLLGTMMVSAIDRWLTDNQDKLLPLVEKFIKDGAGQALLNALGSKFDWDFQQMGQSIAQKLMAR